MKKYFFFSFFIVAVLAVLPVANAQSLIGTACEEPPDYVGGPIYRLICNGNTIVTEECVATEDCHALFSKGYRQCQDDAYECARKCEKERNDSCSNSNGAPGCDASSKVCHSSCSKVNVQCYKMNRDNAERCEKKRHWEKSNIANGRVCDKDTPCVHICDPGTQCVQNGDDAKCVSSSEQPASPPAENAPEVEALAERAPTETDLLPVSQPEALNSQRSQDWGEAIVERLTGGADLLLPGADPNADSSWKEVKVGDVIPRGGKLFTSYASEATLQFANNVVIVVLALSEIEINKPEDYVRTSGRLELGTGDVKFKVQQGDFRTDMQVTTPNSTASPTGTHLRAAYDKNTGVTVYEIYDGSLLVTNKAGETKIISSSYGKPIERIEVAKDGAMTEQIAIPKDEWQARRTESVPQAQSKESRGNGVLWILFTLTLGGGVFALYKTGKLKLIIQKVLALVRRDKSKSL